MNDYRRMVVAMVDARAVVLSLLRQLDLDQKINKEQLQSIIRQCALDMVQKKLRPLGRKPRRRHGVKRVVSSRASIRGTRRVAVRMVAAASTRKQIVPTSLGLISTKLRIVDTMVTSAWDRGINFPDVD